MKKNAGLCLILLASLYVSSQDTITPHILKSGNGLVKIRINDQLSNWRLEGSRKNESLELALDKKNIISFITNLDSVSFNVDINQYRKLSVIYTKDTFNLLIHGYKYIKPANFSKSYIKKHKGRIFVEIPAVHELVQIVIALTQEAEINPSLIEKNTSYYNDVISWYSRFKNHEAVLLVDSLLKENQYHNIKMNSYAFAFKQSRIIEGGVYDRISFGRQQNIIRPYIALLENFSVQSNFQLFYKRHKPYYSYLIKEQSKIVNAMRMWKWLEERFDDRYDCYKITFSPLVLGNHSTQRFDDNGFKETIMFIAPPDSTVSWRKFVSGGRMGFEGELARMIFTEIDHNYVNPVSDIYKQQIDSVFANKMTWATDQAWASYRTAYSVFNEYMTWAVFTLYVWDTYKTEDFYLINENMSTLMESNRGFIRFKDFSNKLLEVYKNTETKSIRLLYQPILEWCISIIR